MCKHRSALFMEKRKSLSLLVCNVCRQPFWKDATGREIADKELIAKLERKTQTKSRRHRPFVAVGGKREAIDI